MSHSILVLTVLSFLVCSGLPSQVEAEAAGEALASSAAPLRWVGDISLLAGGSYAVSAEHYRPWPGEGPRRDQEKHFGGAASGVGASLGLGLGKHLTLSAFTRIDFIGMWHYVGAHEALGTPTFQFGPQVTLSTSAREGGFLKLRGGYAHAEGNGLQGGIGVGYGLKCHPAACLSIAADVSALFTKEHVEGSFGDYYYVHRAFLAGLVLGVRLSDLTD